MILDAVTVEIVRTYCLSLPFNVSLILLLSLIGEKKMTGEEGLGLMLIGPVGSIILSWNLSRYLAWVWCHFIVRPKVKSNTHCVTEV